MTTTTDNAKAYTQLLSWRNDVSMQLLADVDYSYGFSFENGDVAFVDCDIADEDFLPGQWTYEADDGTYKFMLVPMVVKGEARLQYRIEMTERV